MSLPVSWLFFVDCGFPNIDSLIESYYEEDELRDLSDDSEEEEEDNSLDNGANTVLVPQELSLFPRKLFPFPLETIHGFRNLFFCIQSMTLSCL